jgi:nucleoside-diphosphate-sugar epimerase
MKILVIGAGFLGGPIVRRLQTEGHELFILSRTKKPLIQSRQIIGDFSSDRDLLMALSWGPQVVIHTAWFAKSGSYHEDPSNSDYADHTIRLANRVVESNIQHFIVLGSCAEYGTQTAPVAAGRTKVNPESFYANRKVFAFNESKKILENSGTRFTWARVFYPFGPDQDKDRLIPFLIHSIIQGSRIRLNDPTTIHDWITTRDVSSAISWIVEHDTAQEIDIGSGKGHSNVELVKHLALLIGESEPNLELDSFLPITRNVIQVDEDSPLFNSGWHPLDDLNSGLKWILNK